MGKDDTNEDLTEDLTEQNIGTAFSDALRASSATQQEVVADDVQLESDDAQQAAGEVTEAIDSTEPSFSDSELFTAARQLGISLDGIEDEAGLTKATLEQIRKMQPYVSYAHQALPYADKLRELESGSKPQSAPVAKSSDEFDPDSYFASKYGGPAWKSEFQNAVDRGQVHLDSDTGLWQSAPGYELMTNNLVGDMNAAHQHSQKFWQEFVHSNPYQKVHEVIKDPILRDVRSLVEEILGQREQATRSQTEIERFEQEHSSWMYQQDASTGAQVPTEKGKEFFATINELVQDGVKDPTKALRTAMKIHGIGKQPAAAPASQPAAAAPPAPAVKPFANGQKAPVNQPEEKKQTFLQSALDRNGHSANANDLMNDEDGPHATTQNELDTLFTRALRSRS